MAANYSEYTTTHQDQQLEEFVAPALRNDMADLLSAIIERVKDAYKNELIDEGWTPPEG